MFWTLRKKVLIGYGLALCLIIAVIVWSLVNMVRLGRAADAILKENYKSIFAAENMIDSLERQDSAMLLYLLDFPGQAVEQFGQNESQFLLWLGRAKDNITIPGEETITQDIETAYSNYLVLFSTLQKAKDSDDATVLKLYDETVLPTFNAIRQQCIELRQINQDTMFKASSTAADVSDRAFWSVFTIGSVSVAVALAFSLLLTSLIVRPVHQVIEASHRISEGDYDVQVRSRSHDEIGVMAEDFNKMVKKLKAYRDLNVKQILSEKHKSEAIIRSIDEGLIVLNAELRIEDANPAAARMFDKDVADLKGLHLLELTRDDKLFNYVKQSFAMHTVSVPQDSEDNIFTIVKGPSQQHYLYSVMPVHAGQEDVVSMVLLLRDITRLKELDRLKSEFVMAASHELKTPLTGIAMSVSLLREKSMHKLDAKEGELLLAADEEVQRLTTLVNDLLDISRIEAGKMPIELDTVPLDLLFEKAVSVFKAQANEKKIELSCKLAADLPRIRADVNKITWVLTNLISNALRYTDAGGSIRLAAQRTGSQVSVSVADNGIGIPYEYQSRVFDKFVQVKTPNRPGGSGLGLSICREIVRAHGGTIWLRSAPGEGSTFTFTVPAAVNS